MTKEVDYPVIDPLPEGIQRPFWSVMIPTYNCADLLKQTLKSVLKQDPGPDEMQIEVIDDCSTKDDPQAVVDEFGRGRVTFFRQPKNAGAQATFTTCIQRAKGRWVHILHGDDMVLPGYYERLRQAAEKEPTIGAAFCRWINIDEDNNWINLSAVESKTPGILRNLLKQLIVRNRIAFPSISVKRNTYEALGGFHPKLFHCADWDMWKRICANYPVWYEPTPLAHWRLHAGSDTSRLIMTAGNVIDERNAVEHAQSYLRGTDMAELTSQAKEHIALEALRKAREFLNEGGHKKAAIAQIREGLKTSRSSAVVECMAELITWSGVRSIRKTLGTGHRSA